MSNIYGPPPHAPISLPPPSTSPITSLAEFRTLVLRYAPELLEGLMRVKVYPAVKKLAERCGFPRKLRADEDAHETMTEIWFHIQDVYLPARKSSPEATAA
jgi:hypothetical protein